jgi:hypothetical protein
MAARPREARLRRDEAAIQGRNSNYLGLWPWMVGSSPLLSGLA